MELLDDWTSNQVVVVIEKLSLQHLQQDNGPGVALEVVKCSATNDQG